MLDIFSVNLGPFLAVIVAVFGFLHLGISEDHKNYIKERIDKFTSLDYTKLPKTLAKYALDFIDYVFGLKGDYLPRAFQIIHISICITIIAWFLGIFIHNNNPLHLIWIALDLSFITVLICAGLERIDTLIHKKYFWHGYVTFISILLLCDYSLDITFLYSNVNSWLLSILLVTVLCVINLLFDVLTVVVTIKILQRLSESGLLVQVLLIICGIITAYTLMLLEYYILLFAYSTMSVVGVDFKWLFYFIDTFGTRLNVDNYADYRKVVRYTIEQPVLYAINYHEILGHLKQAIQAKTLWVETNKEVTKACCTIDEVSFMLTPITTRILYSSTTLIPTALYLCTLFVSVISKLILQSTCYTLKSISEKEDYPIFVALGFLSVIVTFITWIIIMVYVPSVTKDSP